MSVIVRFGSVRVVPGLLAGLFLAAGCSRADPEYRKTVAVVEQHSKIQKKADADRAAPAAIKELGGPKRAAEKLTKVLLTSRRSAERMGGATGLLIHCGKPATPALVRALGEGKFRARWCAALALGEIGPPAAEAVPALVAALSDVNVGVRGMSARALGMIGPGAKGAVPALRKALASDQQELVRAKAAWALGKVGPAARSAIPDLEKAVKDKSDLVRGAAELALKELRPGGGK